MIIGIFCDINVLEQDTTYNIQLESISMTPSNLQ